MPPLGICTIAFSSLGVGEALQYAAAAGALGVELWGGHHLPEGASPREVASVKRRCHQLGLAMPAYGSYARAGLAEWTPARFLALLPPLMDMGIPRLRVWAGDVASAEASPAQWGAVTDTLRHWGDLAGAAGVQLVVERHCGSLTDYGQSARQLITGVAHPAVRLNYQAPFPWPPDHYATALADDARIHLPHSTHFHVQNYSAQAGDACRTGVGEGLIPYQTWRPLLRDAGYTGWAMLEFLPEDTTLAPLALAQREFAALQAAFG
jgi:sugar phosphate isomerase/epimerase